MGKKEIEIKGIGDLVNFRVVKENGCIINSYRVLVLSFIIVIVTSG